uniref:Uncharacterized protein n=1 Tax=Arundo donax TaxID=35708 RepID=A0A0A8YFT4_ARUDO
MLSNNFSNFSFRFHSNLWVPEGTNGVGGKRRAFVISHGE